MGVRTTTHGTENCLIMQMREGGRREEKKRERGGEEREEVRDKRELQKHKTRAGKGNENDSQWK